jgi:hypothetical protein
MLRDLDPPMDDTTRGRLTRLIDAIETGPPPNLDDLVVADRPGRIVGDGGPMAPGHRRRAPLVVGIAAAVALLVGVALVLRSSSDDDGDADVSNDPGDVPRLVVDPTAVPAGFADDVPYAADLPLGPDQVDPGTTTMTLYGDPGLADPVLDVELAVIVVEDETMGMDGTPTTVRGHAGRRGTTSEFNDIGLADQEAGINWLLWDETDDVEITLASRHLDPTTLDEIAATLQVDGADVRLGSLPRTVTSVLEPIGNLDGVPFLGAPYASGIAPGHTAFYGSVAGGPTLQVATYVGDERNLAAIRWMARAEDPVELRETQGWIGQAPLDDGGVMTTVVWEEAPGVLAVVQAGGMTADEALGIAGSLRAASPAEWDEMVRNRPGG